MCFISFLSVFYSPSWKPRFKQKQILPYKKIYCLFPAFISNPNIFFSILCHKRVHYFSKLFSLLFSLELILHFNNTTNTNSIHCSAVSFWTYTKTKMSLCLIASLLVDLLHQLVIMVYQLLLFLAMILTESSKYLTTKWFNHVRAHTLH